MDEHGIETAHSPFRLVTFRDRLADALHLALLRGAPVLARAALVLLDGGQTPDALLERLRAADDAPAGGAAASGGSGGGMQGGAAPSRGGALAEWRRNGAGSQILADLGLGKLRVMGTARKQVGLAGFGLEVVEYLDPQS